MPQQRGLVVSSPPATTVSWDRISPGYRVVAFKFKKEAHMFLINQGMFTVVLTSAERLHR
jgi:hypothetical protein